MAKALSIQPELPAAAQSAAFDWPELSFLKDIVDSALADLYRVRPLSVRGRRTARRSATAWRSPPSSRPRPVSATPRPSAAGCSTSSSPLPPAAQRLRGDDLRTSSSEVAEIEAVEAIRAEAASCPETASSRQRLCPRIASPMLVGSACPLAGTWDRSPCAGWPSPSVPTPAGTGRFRPRSHGSGPRGDRSRGCRWPSLGIGRPGGTVVRSSRHRPHDPKSLCGLDWGNARAVGPRAVSTSGRIDGNEILGLCWIAANMMREERARRFVGNPDLRQRRPLCLYLLRRQMACGKWARYRPLSPSAGTFPRHGRIRRSLAQGCSSFGRLPTATRAPLIRVRSKVAQELIDQTAWI